MLSAKSLTKKQISDSIQIMEMLSDGNLLCSIIEGKKADSPVSLRQTGKRAEPRDFADLRPFERSRIIHEGARSLFAERDIKQAIMVMDRLLGPKPKVKNSGGFNITHWKRVKKDVRDIKSSFKTDAPKITQS